MVIRESTQQEEKEKIAVEHLAENSSFENLDRDWLKWCVSAKEY